MKSPSIVALLASLFASTAAAATDRAALRARNADLVAGSERACRKGDVRACVRYGEKARNGHGTALNVELAGVLFAYACDAGDAVGCYRLSTYLAADAWFDGPQLFARIERAHDALENACTALDIEACAHLATLELMAPIPREQREEAVTTLRQACQKNEVHACFALGRELETREGAKDRRAAFDAYGRACRAGSARACHREGMLRLGRMSPRQAPALAKEAFERACAWGVRRACRILSAPDAAATRDRTPRPLLDY